MQPIIFSFASNNLLFSKILVSLILSESMSTILLQKVGSTELFFK